VEINDEHLFQPDFSSLTKKRKRLVERGVGDGFVNQYYREGYTQELEKELTLLKKKLGGLTQANQSKNAKIDELKESLKKKSLDLKALSSKSHEKHIIKSHLEKHCTPAQTRKLLNPEFNHQRKYEESDFLLAAALKSMSPEAYRMIRRKSILSLPGRTLINTWLKEHKEYSGIFVGCRKRCDEAEESEDEVVVDSATAESEPPFVTENIKLKNFLHNVPDKIDVNVRSDVVASILQLKKKSFHQTIDFFDECIGSIEDKNNPSSLEFAVALLRQTLLTISTPQNITNTMIPRLQLGIALLHLSTRTSDFSGLYNYYKMVEREAGKDNISWTNKHLILTLVDTLILRADNDSDFQYDHNLLPDSMKKDDEMIVTDEDGNPVLLTYVDISEALGDNAEHNVQVLNEGAVSTESSERSAIEGMVQLSTDPVQQTNMPKPTEKNPVAEQKRINKRLKKKKMTKQFGDAGVNFSGTVECNLCGVKVDNFSSLNNHQFHVHQQGQTCPLCGSVSKTYEAYLEHSKSHPQKCGQCNKDFNCTPDVNRHMDLFHLPSQCPVCLKVCAHKHGLKSHMTQTHKNNSIKELECNICKFKSFSRVQMIDHIQTIHKNGNGFKVYSSSNLKNKRKMVTNKDVSKSNSVICSCNICGRILSSPELLQDHMRTLHCLDQSQYLQCQKCAFRTPYLHNLKRHQEMHANNENESIIVESLSMDSISVVQTIPEVIVETSLTTSGGVTEQFAVPSTSTQVPEVHSQIPEAASEVPEAAEVMEVSEAAEWLLNQ